MKIHIWKSTMWIVNLLLAFFTIAAGYGGVVNPEISSIPAILAMTFPGWIFLIAMMIIVDWFACRRVIIMPLLSLMLTWGALANFSPINFSNSKSHDNAGTDSTFTFMSYNVFAFFNHPKITASKNDNQQTQKEAKADAVNATASYILEKHPDLATFQEFPAFHPNKHLHYTQLQVDSMLTLFPHHVDVRGEAVCSRYNLTPVQLRQPNGNFAWYCGAMANIQGHQVLVVSVHLESIGLNDEDKELYTELTKGEGRNKMHKVKQQLLSKLSAAFKKRAQQAQLLREQIDSLGVENVIIAGDFNDIQGCYALRELCQDDFKNAFVEAGCGPTITYHANRFYFHIDHIVYRGKMKAIDYTRGRCPYSDHYPIMATFKWEE